MAWYHAKGANGVTLTASSPMGVARPRPLSGLQKIAIAEPYAGLAAEIGFQPGQLLHKEIRNFLIEQQIPIYSYRAVADYMERLASAEGANFFWRPLRQKDQEIFGTWNWGINDKHDYYHRGRSECSPYDKLVPLHILNDVKTILDRFGETVAFFVTDYKAIKPDPFILVTAPSETFGHIIFGAWDEPGFGVV